MKRTYLTDCTLVLPQETIQKGSLVIEDQRISSICPNSVSGRFLELNLGGAYLMPGLIDLHSDAIESLAEPRSGIYLPFDLATRQLDQIAAGNGITTMFNAISFAGEELGLRNEDAPSKLVSAVYDHRPRALVDQRVHCRYEVTVESALPKIIDLIQAGVCGIVSYMDHSPGQGQFQDEENYRNYMSTRYGYDPEKITCLLDSKKLIKKDPSAVKARIATLADVAASTNVPLAGHDAESAEHVEEMLSLGAVLAEFPMSQQAADAARAAGLQQCVGAVNVIRGKSQRTGMSASALIQSGHADCLCSDYVPGALLPAIVRLAKQLSRPLHEIAKIATSNPARAARLDDRGILEVGLRADLVCFVIDQESQLPKVLATWSRGQMAYSILDLLGLVETNHQIASDRN